MRRLHAHYRRLNDYSPSKLVVGTRKSAVEPVAESLSNAVQQIQIPVITIEPPPPLSPMQDNLCYVQQTIHSSLMQRINRKNHEAMIDSWKQARRPIIGGQIRNTAEVYKFRPFKDLDDEILRQWIVQWEFKKGNGVPNPRQLNDISNELVNKWRTHLELMVFQQ